MYCQNNKIILSLATEDDNEGMNKVFESGRFDGGFSVQFLRKPKPLESFRKDGDTAKILIMKDALTLEVIAVGGCVIRREYLDGSVKRIGYLTGLKILPAYQKKIRCIAESYQFLHENTKDEVDLYYTTILSSNTGAQKLLEKRHRNMPAYRYLGEYTTYCLRAGGRSGGRYGGRSGGKSEGRFGSSLTGATADEVAQLYGSSLRKLNLAPMNTELSGLSAEDFYTLRDVRQDIIACCAIYKQQSYKQYVISDYNRMYRILSKLPVHLLGYPKFPAQNSYLNYASVAFLYVKDNNIRLGRQFLRAAMNQAGRTGQAGMTGRTEQESHSGRIDVLLAGQFCNNPLRGIFDRIRHVKFQSRLYEVSWDEPQYIDSNPVGLEVSLL